MGPIIWGWLKVVFFVSVLWAALFGGMFSPPRIRTMHPMERPKAVGRTIADVSFEHVYGTAIEDPTWLLSPIGHNSVLRWADTPLSTALSSKKERMRVAVETVAVIEEDEYPVNRVHFELVDPTGSVVAQLKKELVVQLDDRLHSGRFYRAVLIRQGTDLIIDQLDRIA